MSGPDEGNVYFACPHCGERNYVTECGICHKQMDGLSFWQKIAYRFSPVEFSVSFLLALATLWLATSAC